MQAIAAFASQILCESDFPADLTAELSNGFQCVSARHLARQHYPQVDLSLPLMIGDVDALDLAYKIKTTLLFAYPADHPVALLYGTDRAAQSVIASTLATFDQAADFDAPCTLYLPAIPAAGFTALQAIVAHLRTPEGCPWDRAQTLQSMRHDLLSECSEVLEAIDAEVDNLDNSVHIAEELGDLLMAATLMIQIATEAGRFQMADVINGVVTKLIRRHPHVFGETTVDGVQHVLANWEAIKKQEKIAKGQIKDHPLDGVPAPLPALEKARQLQSKAAKAGLLDRAALAQMTPTLKIVLGANPDEQQLGELLWQLVALATELGLNAEDALRHYIVQYRQQTI
jgi:tetrapyrrole methylase family protein / MazG family protein